MDIGKRIRKLRENRGIEQLELAKMIGISQSKMNKIESGFQKRIEPEILVDLSETLNATVDYLVGNSDQPHLTKEETFDEFINDPELKRWHRELPKTPEEDLRKLRKMWEIMQEDKD